MDEAWGEAEREQQEKFGEHNSVNKAASAANATMPKGKAKGPQTKAEENKILEDLANDVIGDGDEERKKVYLENIKDLPFILESINFPGNEFIEIQHLSNKVIIRLNTRHKFYREMWEPIKSISQQVSGREIQGSDYVLEEILEYDDDKSEGCELEHFINKIPERFSDINCSSIYYCWIS